MKFKKEKGFYQYLENLVILDMENFNSELTKKYSNVFKIYSFEEILESGSKNSKSWADITP